MRGRVGPILAGAALAVGGGVVGAVVVAPALVDEQARVAGYAQVGKEERATPQHTFHVAKKARSMARGARQLLDGAIPQIEQASDSATAANDRIDSTQIVSDTQAGLVQTGNTGDYVALGGPQVTVNVPSSGLLEVWATVTFGADGDASVAADGAVALYEDGQRVTQIDEENLCQSFTGSGLENMLLATSGPAGAEIALSTPGAVEVFAGGCGAIGSTPSPILLRASPGTHTYELRYGDCGCEAEPAGFKQRTLRVAPHL